MNLKYFSTILLSTMHTSAMMEDDSNGLLREMYIKQQEAKKETMSNETQSKQASEQTYTSIKSYSTKCDMM